MARLITEKPKSKARHSRPFLTDSDKDTRMTKCDHLDQSWQETSFTSGGWNVRIFCFDCGQHLTFRRLSDVVG